MFHLFLLLQITQWGPPHECFTYSYLILQFTHCDPPHHNLLPHLTPTIYSPHHLTPPSNPSLPYHHHLLLAKLYGKGDTTSLHGVELTNNELYVNNKVGYMAYITPITDSIIGPMGASDY